MNEIQAVSRYPLIYGCLVFESVSGKILRCGQPGVSISLVFVIVVLTSVEDAAGKENLITAWHGDFAGAVLPRRQAKPHHRGHAGGTTYPPHYICFFPVILFPKIQMSQFISNILNILDTFCIQRDASLPGLAKVNIFEINTPQPPVEGRVVIGNQIFCVVT